MNKPVPGRGEAPQAEHPEIGGILHLEHVNFTVPGQDLITVFFINGLGFTRDPYRRTDETNFGVNVGMQQFHLPTGGETPPFPGLIRLVAPDCDLIRFRLRRLEEMGKFDGTRYARGEDETKNALDIVSPWGPRLRIVPADQTLFPRPLGLHGVDLPVPPGTAEGVAAYYREVMDAPVEQITLNGADAVAVTMGPYQTVRFYEGGPADFDYDYRSFHLCFYIARYNAIAARLEADGKLKGKRGPMLFFSREIFDPRNGKTLFLLETEVRSVYHPDFMRPLVNRWPIVAEPFIDQFQARRDLFGAVGFTPGQPVKPVGS